MVTVEMLRGVWRFRSFVAASVKREFSSRYLNTKLGVVWPILQPLTTILIFTLVFAEVMKTRLPDSDSRFAYSIYLTSGVIIWGLFSDLLGKSVGVFVQNGPLMKKANFPKLTLPLISAVAVMLQTSIITGLFLVFLIISGNFSGLVVFSAIPVFILTALLATALGVLLATVNVFYRDVEQGTMVILQFWFWLTPVVYPSKALPKFMEGILAWNPMWPIVQSIQDIFLRGKYPDWLSLLYPLALAIAFAVLARFTFDKLAGELVDEL